MNVFLQHSALFNKSGNKDNGKMFGVELRGQEIRIVNE
jgi:hypothetical protein